ncbi:FadR/GntR family transcriptional regulator [Notoacmeibacter sp. MSK16QG-6]|uniref:FadR/GntR family transcriptional regulator n=1 Tax=Notoacmeibacter sp. MSK16QG-6 TaxID=2957982 RepID=UPI00209DC139|nr:FadR/GntR family transcriptional regulator [Notoacmeibacter sp. MSK16QG-6]MCP1200842.1 FadR family transcriptional regulator [Notoacmeibacter sp. MSK16QG-6]
MVTAKTKTRMPLAEQVYRSLHGRIANGDYPANEKLPPEMKLAEEFGVSRPVLRAALERLRKEGVVNSRQGAGTFVRQSQTSVPIGFAKVETLADVQRCYEFRINLETEAAALAAERHNPGLLAETEQALELLRAATGSLQHREDADFMFHSSIARASNNHYFEAAFRALRDHVNVGMKLHGESLMNDGRKGLEEVLAEHTDIYEAIRNRDPEEARARMRLHLEHSRDRLFGGGQFDLRLT